MYLCTERRIFQFETNLCSLRIKVCELDLEKCMSWTKRNLLERKRKKKVILKEEGVRVGHRTVAPNAMFNIQKRSTILITEHHH